jgi:ligand-binding sensor domain-containing protein/signal transduction histidine kinase
LSKYFLYRVAAFVCVVFLFLIQTRPAFGQKYTFAHYDIEDGLIQSQVNKFSMDKEHRLWIATYGGVCRFDGNDFMGYSRQNGLPNNFVATVFADKMGRTWFGTLDGLAMLYNGKIKNYKPITGTKQNVVTDIAQDGDGNIWVVMSYRLYKIAGDKMQPTAFDDNTKVTSIEVNSSGKLYAAIYQKGLYYLAGNKWICNTPFTDRYESLNVIRILFDKFDKQKIYLLANNKVFYINNGELMPFAPEQTGMIKGLLLCITQDVYKKLWIGTDNGAYCILDDEAIHYNSSNGLTDNPIKDIYSDTDGNLWLASAGNGVYRCEGSKYVTFDSSQGIPESKIVMAVTNDWSGHVLLGVDGGGLIRHENQKLNNIKAPILKGIQCLYTDKNKTTWIGTDQSGLWRYDKNGFKQIKGSEELAIHNVAVDSSGTVWLATSGGCDYYENGSIKHLNGVTDFSSSIMVSGRDSVFVGTQNGVVLVLNKKVVNTFRLSPLKNSAIYSMIRYRDLMLVGTDDSGIFAWDIKSGDFKRYTVTDGLKANSIYSLVADESGNVWVGTGKGVNRMKFNPGNKRFTVIDNTGSKEQIFETNQNAIIYKDHQVWVGTTKAVLVYNTRVMAQSSNPPNIIIEDVKLMPQIGTNKSTDYTYLDNNARLNYNQNHLSISFLGVYLKNPAGVSYRYKLVGLDSTFCSPMKNNVVEYPQLPPGKYTFKVKAISPDGKVSANTADFRFEIVPPFYKTLTFQISAVLFFVLIGFGLQNIWHHSKIQRQQVIEAMKQEEKIKIRQQTAEDFHDDLGNKLTRISILSEILNAKIDQHKTDQRGLVDQIKQNAAALYNGTKDILWALDPKSDNLYETLIHVKEIGIELFQDVSVEFKVDGIDENLKQIKLPMEYSRNITMIFKESLNNALKHAEASLVTLQWSYADKNDVGLRLIDNGKGFNCELTAKGHGMHNIKARAKRINAELTIISEVDKGTSVELKFSKNAAG